MFETQEKISTNRIAKYFFSDNNSGENCGEVNSQIFPRTEKNVISNTKKNAVFESPEFPKITLKTSDKKLTNKGIKRNCFGYGSTEIFLNRWYDPKTGQFLSPDPVDIDINNPMTFNKYAFCNNNPWRYTDPTGMWSQQQYAEKTVNSAHKSSNISKLLLELINYLKEQNNWESSAEQEMENLLKGLGEFFYYTPNDKRINTMHSLGLGFGTTLDDNMINLAIKFNGKFLLHGRNDATRHFFLGAGISSGNSLGKTAAYQIGLQKEWRDSMRGQGFTHFDFSDLGYTVAGGNFADLFDLIFDKNVVKKINSLQTKLKNNKNYLNDLTPDLNSYGNRTYSRFWFETLFTDFSETKTLNKIASFNVNSAFKDIMKKINKSIQDKLNDL